MLKDNSHDFQIHRSNSFHGKKANRLQSEDETEDDYGSGYDSSIAESHVRKHPHFYLDDDELILPIHSSCTHLAQRSSKSPQISPSKSRSKLEALDSLVISTIYNISNKLCGASANVLRKAANVFPEKDEEQVCTVTDIALLVAYECTVGNLKCYLGDLPLNQVLSFQSSTLETVLYLLEDVDLPATPAKKTSRELSGETHSATPVYK